MKKIRRVLSLCVSIFGLISLIHINEQAFGLQPQEKTYHYDDLEPAQSFVANFVSSSLDPNGNVSVTATRTRYVKANGEWREVILRKGTPAVTIYCGTIDGVYEKRAGSSSRRFVSEAANEQMRMAFRSPKSLQAHPEFVRTDQVAGLTVYVHRNEIKNPDYKGYWIETSYSPKTGLNPLRTIMHFGDGSETKTEAVSVEFSEVPESLNEDLTSSPAKRKQD